MEVQTSMEVPKSPRPINNCVENNLTPTKMDKMYTANH